MKINTFYSNCITSRKNNGTFDSMKNKLSKVYRIKFVDLILYYVVFSILTMIVENYLENLLIIIYRLTLDKKKSYIQIKNIIF